jgi:hypothetical protein
MEEITKEAIVSLMLMIRANYKYITRAMKTDVDVTKSFFEKSSDFINDEEEEKLIRSKAVTRKTMKFTLETKLGYVLIPMPAKII